MNQLLAYLDERLKKEASLFSDALVMGNAVDFAEYRHICGKHRGLLLAIDIVKEVAERMREDGDLE